jgi:hypothetical protein
MDWLDKLISACSMLIGMLPPALTGFGWYPLSPLYQPRFYEHQEPFVIIPVMVAMFASWSIIHKSWAMIPIFIISICLAALVYYLYVSLDDASPFNAVNWILSYCVFALAIAMFGGLVIALKKV